MKEIGQRLKILRTKKKLTQVQMAEILGVKQTSVAKYEHGTAVPSIENFRKYADYFDVSMDYIFARTEHPKGKLYENKSKCDSDNTDIQKFVEMCFDPESPFNARLKQTLVQMMEETEK